MSAFYIKSIMATGPDKIPSEVTFKPGLNIICGASDTGKSALLKSIKFLFGGDKPFPKNTGFDTVSMTLGTLNGNIKLHRKLGKNIIKVQSEVNFIKSGDYAIEYNKDKPKEPVINSVLLKLMGINTEPMIIKNKDFGRNRLTFNTFLKSFYLTEDNIGSADSIILPTQSTAVCAFLSALIYLFQGEDFAGMEVQETETISAARKNALETFVGKQLSKASKQSSKLQEELKAYKDVDMEMKLQQLVEKLTATEGSIFSATEESKTLMGALLKYKEKEAECEMILSRYEALKSQYIGDINRLTFITEGENLMEDLPPKDACPFCNGNLPPVHKESYLAASRAELARIIAQLQGLTESEEDIKEELKTIQNELNNLQLKHHKIQQLLEEKLTPQAKELKNTLSKYRSFIELQKEITLLNSVSKEMEEDLMEDTKAPNKKSTFKPKDHLPKDFSNILSKYAYDILKECKYQGLNTVHFNPGTFDLVVNGEKKSENHGKGYRAFINTILGLVFRQYYSNNSIYNPGLFIVDSPLLGLDQGLDDQNPESMKTSLLNYFINHGSEGQIILVENSKYLPSMDYEGAGVNIMEFTHGNFKSMYRKNRYGYLVGVVSGDKTP